VIRGGPGSRLKAAKQSGRRRRIQQLMFASDQPAVPVPIEVAAMEGGPVPKGGVAKQQEAKTRNSDQRDHRGSQLQLSTGDLTAETTARCRPIFSGASSVPNSMANHTRL